MKINSVYTKTGDKGMTSLVGGKRVPKNDIRLESYGTIDELNSFIGLLITYVGDPDDGKMLLYIQNKLFSVGSYLATDPEKQKPGELKYITPPDIEKLEEGINAINDKLPVLEKFIVPGGAREAAMCHICRTICRRAERRILSVADQSFVEPEVIAFVNRLSDYLFVLARKLNLKKNGAEIFWGI